MKILAVALLVALAIFLVLYVTLVGRRRLAQRTTTLVPVPPPVPGSDTGGSGASGVGPVRFGPLEAVYVSTTLHGDWLARVGAHGLGDRSSALVSVHDAGPGQDGGVLIERDGAQDLWVPVNAIRSAGLAPGMAGKYVGTDGLVVLTWAVPEADGVAAALVDTGLRTRRAEDRGGLVDAVRYLLAAQQPQQAHHPQQHPQQYPYQQEAR
ncbi:PH-like domain-containing protein [Promicromonospora soli]